MEEIMKKLCVTKPLTNNQRFRSYQVEGQIPVSGQMFVTINADQPVVKSRSFRTESYEQYLSYRETMSEHNLGWIHGIIDGRAEQDKVIHHDDEFLLIPDYVWDSETLGQLHVLGIVKDKSLMSLRDIGLQDLDMLKRIRETGLLIINQIYGLPDDKVKMFFHYPPSTYLLHIHFTHADVFDSGTSVERAHNLDDVIKNIGLDKDYYHGDLRIITHL
jgi:hypothetical protein